jgi:ubiquinone/menaquinone biosynthesis C-methylase UbiE
MSRSTTIEATVSRSTARRIYDRLGARIDRAEHQEARAKALALDLLRLAPGQHVLHVGVGAGREQAAIQAAVGPNGLVVGCDLSRGMLELTRRRAAAPLCQADAGALPLIGQRFDRLFSAYVLDLLPGSDLPGVLAEFRRVLRPGGRLVLVSLTEGSDPASRAFIALWKLRYRLAPASLGGCRPLRLAGLVGQAGFTIEQRQVVVQRGFPSEIIVGV